MIGFGPGAGVTVTGTVQLAVWLFALVAVIVYVVVAAGFTRMGPCNPAPATVGDTVTAVALVVV